jgi:antitoxin (DNA-binding transcriptional repressor) of toxin-antitoxin stability system
MTEPQGLDVGARLLRCARNDGPCHCEERATKQSEWAMASEYTITASAFKAKCRSLLDQLANGKLTRLSVTKHGRVVAIVTPPDDVPNIRELHGFMRGSVVAPGGFDFTSRALDEPLSADQGQIDE